MANCLKSSTKFRCNLSNTVLFFADDRSSKIFSDGDRILTTRTKLFPNGVCTCPYNPQPGLPCTVNGSVKWSKTSSKIKNNSISLLTDDSFAKPFTCAYGATLKSIAFLDSRISEIKDFHVAFKQNFENSSHKNDVRKSSEKTTKFIESQNQLNVDLQGNEQNNLLTVTEDKVVDEVLPDVKYAICDYKNCKDKKNCEYLKSSLNIGNSSQHLKRNYIKQYPDIYEKQKKELIRQYKELRKNKHYLSCIHTFHHIVPGNQVFGMKDRNGEFKFGILIKLANYFFSSDGDGEFINCAENCMLLITSRKKTKISSDLFKDVKHSKAYLAMESLKKQWHEGGHSYTLDQDTLLDIKKYFDKNPVEYDCLADCNGNFVVSYSNLVSEELEKFQNKYTRKQCPAKNFEVNKQKFKKDFTKIVGNLLEKNKSEKGIRDYLTDFELSPRKSFPFYVSKVAIEYAFKIPKRFKVIIIYLENNVLYAKKIVLSRFLKNDNKLFIQKELDKTRFASNFDFIKFCENVSFFFVDSGLRNQFKLNFNPRSDNYNFILYLKGLKEDCKSFISEYSAEIVSFLVEHESPYISAYKLVELRKVDDCIT